MAQVHEVTLAILGGGPAGYLAAVRAKQMGASVAIIEREEFGGVCLNRGCIPTKALLRTTELTSICCRGQEFGVQGQPSIVSWPAGHRRKERVVKSLRLGVEHLLKHEQIHIIRGQGSIVDPQCLTVETDNGVEAVHCQKLLVATGSEPVRPPIAGIQLPRVLTSDELLTLEEIPKRLAIIGGGVIGLEFAQMFNRLGSKVSIIEMARQLLPQDDSEMAGEVLKILKRQGVQVYLAGTVTEIAVAQAGVAVKFQFQDKIILMEADYVLLATGRKPVVPPELASLSAAMSAQGALIVNEQMETNVPGIYAAGDVTGGKLLAHKAYMEGRIAVENALGFPRIMNEQTVPSCVYIQPELATVGLNESEAAAQGREVRTGRFYFRNNGRALCLGEREGLVKVVTDSRTHIVLGGQILGPQATELISELTIAVSLGLKADVLADLVHPHPALSEAVMEACADAVGRAIHKA
ncbi:pyridine nucleotide disulphide reductase class-i signature [Lucifera butyrica]|uniref:Dihydrolipoyl dehydrogenase n=1 Tax=Lucifera butyrica TaxID=1351585 RepID=A0A498RDA6_9FIRM|nr:dihydrolipoyl dehydrogenase [Lucifera butyrica]VBB08897.1 pyridine nucleotide disulphide reductase class-i signature [Lucifera butyrica]